MFCIKQFDLELNDLARRSAWGVVGNKIKVVDYGLSNYVYNAYYKR